MSNKKSKRKQQQQSANTSDVSFEELQSFHFSPVEVPTGRSPAQGNLTGSARKVKDTAADWHNGILKWNKLNEKGFQVASQIANSKLSALFGSGEEDTGVLSTEMPEGMESLVIELENIYKSMETIVKKQEKMTEILKNVSELEWHQNNQAWDPEFLFQTWPTNQFYLTSEEMLEVYKKELSLKKAIVENIAHTTDRNLLMFYTSAWSHQPYISDRCKLLMESMLKETGHK